MIYVHKLTDDETRELRRMTCQEIGRVSQRAQMVLLSSQRRTVPEIARIFETTRATVRFWIRRFEQRGAAGLYDEPRAGRPRKVKPEVLGTIDGMVRQDPLSFQFLATFWTMAMMVQALAVKLGVHLSVSTLRSALRQLGLRWGRPRLAMPRKVDPQKAAKQWQIAQAVIEAGAEAVILYMDESRVQLLPLVRAMWHWIGQQVRIPTPGTNETRALFGALNLRTGRWVYRECQRLLAEEFVTFLEQLLLAYPTGPIVLIADNFSSHRAKRVTAWVAAQSRLRLLYLPTYCSHLNPVEGIWRQLKNHLAANRLYGSMDLLSHTVFSFFEAMTPEQALAWAGA
jgi:transposase